MALIRLLTIITTFSVLVSCQRGSFEPKKKNESEKMHNLVSQNSPELPADVKNAIVSKMQPAGFDSKTSQYSETELKEFYEFAQVGCDDKLSGCKNINELKENPDAGFIVASNLTLYSELSTIDRIIRLASELKSNSQDLRVDELVLRAIFKNIRGLLKKDTDLYQKLFSIYLAKSNVLSSEEIFTSLMQLDVLNLSSQELTKNIRLLSFKKVLTTFSNDARMAAKIKDFVESSLIKKFYNETAATNPGLFKISQVENLRLSATELVLINFIDNRISTQDVLEIFKGFSFGLSAEKNKEIQDQILNFFRIYTLYSSQIANNNFAERVERFRRVAELGEFLENVSSISSKNRAVWTQFLNNVESGLSFSRLFGDGDLEFKEFSSKARRNIQFMSSMPHLAIVVYIISVNKLTLKFRFFGFSFDINYKTILNIFLKGELKDLLSYIDNASSLTTEDIATSMYYAFRSNLFEMLGIDPYDFINQTVMTVLSDDIYRFKSDTDNLKMILTQSGYFQKIAAINEIAETRNLQNYKMSFSEFLADPLFGSEHMDRFTFEAFLCSFQQSCSAHNSFNGYSILYTQLAERVEIIKNFLSQRFRLISAVKISLEQAQLEKGVTKEKIDEKFAQSSPLFGEFVGRQKHFAEVINQYQKTYFDLALRTFSNSRKTKVAVFMSELDHLKRIYEMMKKMRAKTMAVSDAQDYLKKTNSNVGLSEYTTYESVNGDYYSVHSMDHILRMINQTTNHLGGDSKRSTIVTISDDYIKKLQNGVFSTGIVKKIRFTIPFNDNPEEFLRDAMSKLFYMQNITDMKQANEGSNWFNNNPTLHRVWRNFNGNDSRFFHILGPIYLMSKLLDVPTSAKELVDRAITSYQFLNVSADEMEFYKYTNTKGYYRIEYINAPDVDSPAVFDVQTMRPRSVLERVYLTVAQPSLKMGRKDDQNATDGAHSYDWNMADYKTDIRNYSVNRKVRGKLFFEVSPKLDELIEQQSISMLVKNYQAVRELEAEIKKRTNEQSIYHVEKEQRFEMPLIETKFFDQYQMHIDEFHRLTESIYTKYLPN